MKRILAASAVALLVVLGIAAVYGYGRVTELEVEQVTDDVYMLSGFGGNVGVLRTGTGSVVVDSMTFRMQGERIREAAERLAGPIQAVVNTHYHVGHTHGNPGFAAGTRVISTRRTLDYLVHFDPSYWQGEAAETLPNELFSDVHEVKLGGKTIRAMHLGRGHTGGDLVVLFVDDRVLHTGDLLFNRRYPNIDLEAGGSIREWIATLDRMLELDFDRVIPGHGPLTDRSGIRAFQDFLRELWEVGQQAARDGLSLEETLARKELATDEGYDVISVPLVFRLDEAFVIRRAWEEATGSVVEVEVPEVREEER